VLLFAAVRQLTQLLAWRHHRPSWASCPVIPGLVVAGAVAGVRVAGLVVAGAVAVVGVAGLVVAGAVAVVGVAGLVVAGAAGPSVGAGRIAVALTRALRAAPSRRLPVRGRPRLRRSTVLARSRNPISSTLSVLRRASSRDSGAGDGDHPRGPGPSRRRFRVGDSTLEMTARRRTATVSPGLLTGE
jgi:hypothetical protein